MLLWSDPACFPFFPFLNNLRELHLDLSQNIYLERLYVTANSNVSLKSPCKTGGSRYPDFSKGRDHGFCNQTTEPNPPSSLAHWHWIYIHMLWRGSGTKHSEAQVSAIHVATFPAFAISASYLLYPHFLDVFHQI